MYQVFHQLVGDFSAGFREDQTDRYLLLTIQKLREDSTIVLPEHVHLLLIILQIVGQFGLPIQYVVDLNLVFAQLFPVYLFHLIHGLSTIHGCDSLLSLTNDHNEVVIRAELGQGVTRSRLLFFFFFSFSVSLSLREKDNEIIVIRFARRRGKNPLLG